MKNQVELPDAGLLRRFDVPGPRYTSYPTADRFVEAFDAPTFAAWLGKRGDFSSPAPLSLYVHIPFCNTVCYYCACNKVITKDHGKALEYLDALDREPELISDRLTGVRTVEQLAYRRRLPDFSRQRSVAPLMAIITSKISASGERRGWSRSGPARNCGPTKCVCFARAWL